MNPITNSRRMLLVLLGIAAVSGFLFAIKPAWRGLNTWRAQRLIVSAEAQAARNDWPNAFHSLRDARLLAPDDAGITRSTAQLLGKRGDPQVLTLLETLIQSPGCQAQDRIDFIRMALQLGKIAIAQEHLTVLLRAPETARRFEVLLLAATWYGRAGERSRAVLFARESLARAGDPQQAAEAKLVLARLLLQAPGESPGEAKQRLWEVAAREDAAGLEALRMLSDACKARFSQEEAARLREGLRRHPLARDEDHLLGLTWALQTSPDQREQILAEALSQFREGGPERLAAVGRWLNQQQESRRVLDLIPLTAARENKELFLIHLDALASLGQWLEVQKLLADKASLPINSTIRQLYEVRTAAALGRDDELRQQWYEVQQSMRQADPESVLYVAQYAERLGKRDEAAKAYRLLTRLAGAERAGYLGLIRLTEQSGETRQLRDQVKELAERFPSELEAQNDLAYHDLLLKENVASARTSAERLVKRSPELLAYRTTLALAHLQNGDAAAARAVYREFETDWSTAQPGWHAVYTAVLAASGDQALAREHTREISKGRLRAEERALIADLDAVRAE